MPNDINWGWVFAFLGVCCVVFGNFATIVWLAATLKADVRGLTEAVQELKSIVQGVSEIHKQIAVLENRMDRHSRDIEFLQTRTGACNDPNHNR